MTTGKARPGRLEAGLPVAAAAAALAFNRIAHV